MYGIVGFAFKKSISMIQALSVLERLVVHQYRAAPMKNIISKMELARRGKNVMRLLQVTDRGAASRIQT